MYLFLVSFVCVIKILKRIIPQENIWKKMRVNKITHSQGTDKEWRGGFCQGGLFENPADLLWKHVRWTTKLAGDWGRQRPFLFRVVYI